MLRGWGWGWAVLAVIGRPGLWVTAARQTARLAPLAWWRRRPFLPLPDPGYLRFRLQTIYGDGQQRIEPNDLVTYLHWCREYPRPER